MHYKVFCLLLTISHSLLSVYTQDIQCKTLPNGCDAGQTSRSAITDAIARFQNGFTYGGSAEIIMSSALDGDNLAMVTYLCNDGSVLPKLEGSVVRSKIQSLLSCPNSCGGVALDLEEKCGFGILVVNKAKLLPCFSKAINIIPTGAMDIIDPSSIFAQPLGQDEDDLYIDPSNNDHAPTSSQTSPYMASSGHDEAFSFVIIDGTEGAVDNNFADDWTILDTHTKSFKLKQRKWNDIRRLNARNDTFHHTQETYRVVCAAGMTNTNCSRIFIMNAEDTIIKLPSQIGSGPDARVVNFTYLPNAKIAPSDLSILSRRREKLHLQQDSNETEMVFELVTDFDFVGIHKRQLKDGAEVQFRVDYSNLLEYWDQVDTAVPDGSQQGISSRGLHKRWFGSFKNWLAKVTAIETHDQGSLETNFETTWNLFHFEKACKRVNANYSATLDLDAHVRMGMHVMYSYLFQGHILPTPKTESAYALFSATPFMNLSLILSGEGLVESTTGNIPLLPGLAFPGLSVKGLIRIGPQLDITGRLDASLQVSGQVEAGFAVQMHPFQVAFPQDADGQAATRKPSPLDTNNNQQFHVEPILKAGVQAQGSLSLTITPRLSFGIEVLDGKLMQGDIALGVDNTLDVGLAVQAQVGLGGQNKAAFCIWADYIYRAFIEAKVSVLEASFNWESPLDLATPTEPVSILPRKCLAFGNQNQARVSEGEGHRQALTHTDREARTPLHLKLHNNSIGDLADTIGSIFQGTFSCPIDSSSNSCSVRSHSPSGSSDVNSNSTSCQLFGASCENITMPAWYYADDEDLDSINDSNEDLQSINESNGPSFEDLNILLIANTLDYWAKVDIAPLNPRVGTFCKGIAKVSYSAGSYDTWPVFGQAHTCPVYQPERPKDCQNWNLNDANTLSTTYPPRTAGNKEYGLEHIIEIQTMGKFFDWASENAAVKKSEFCQRVQYFWQGKPNNPGVMRRNAISVLALDVYPNKQTHFDEFVVLESEINNVKKQFFQQNNFQGQTTFETLDDNQKFFVMKRVILTFQYLKNDNIKSKFLQQAQRMGADLTLLESKYIPNAFTMPYIPLGLEGLWYQYLAFQFDWMNNAAIKFFKDNLENMLDDYGWLGEPGDPNLTDAQIGMREALEDIKSKYLQWFNLVPPLMS